MRLEVYGIEPDEQVGCIYCYSWGESPTYVRGEAVLAGPDHPPYNAEANFVCLGHLSSEATIFDPSPTGGKYLISREEYEAMAPYRPEQFWRDPPPTS